MTKDWGVVQALGKIMDLEASLGGLKKFVVVETNALAAQVNRLLTRVSELELRIDALNAALVNHQEMHMRRSTSRG